MFKHSNITMYGYSPEIVNTCTLQKNPGQQSHSTLIT